MNTYTNEELLKLQASMRGDAQDRFANDPAPAIQAIALLDIAISLRAIRAMRQGRLINTKDVKPPVVR